MSDSSISFAAGAPGRPTVSAAICTRNRPDRLGRALESLGRQQIPPDEILVIDNAPSDDRTRALLANRFACARYAREPIVGLDFARNRALREARGEVVAFLDDDAVAAPEWIGAIAQAFTAIPELAICTGRIDPLELETHGQRLFEANGGLFARGDSRVVVSTRSAQRHALRRPNIAWAISLGSGCNLAVRRKVATRLGGFDEALDLGPALPGGGDNDLVWRVLDAGHTVAYEPAARVAHEHRRDVQAVVAQIAGHHRAMIALATKAVVHTRGVRRLPTLAFLGWRLVKPGVRLARRSVGRDPLPVSALLRIWWHCWRGLVAYPWARRIARARRGRANW